MALENKMKFARLQDCNLLCILQPCNVAILTREKCNERKEGLDITKTILRYLYIL